MYDIPCTNFFETCFNDLLLEPVTLTLLCTALYPISFIFGPFMLGRDSVTPPLTGCAAGTYKKRLTDLFNDYISYKQPSDADVDKCNWLYYAIINNSAERPLDKATNKTIQGLWPLMWEIYLKKDEPRKKREGPKAKTN